jgi:cobalt-zinc-cadmium resistance protein CzcA
MLDRLVTFALQQRVFVLIASVVLAIAGAFAWSNLAIEAFPDVQDTQVLIITPYPGQAPEEVERSVSLPIELEMGGVPRMTQLRSVSITGLSVLTLTFADGTNDYFARQQVLERLLGVELPPGVQAQIAPLTNAVGEIYRYVIDAPADMPLNEVRALQDWVLRPSRCASCRVRPRAAACSSAPTPIRACWWAARALRWNSPRLAARPGWRR